MSRRLESGSYPRGVEIAELRHCIQNWLWPFQRASSTSRIQLTRLTANPTICQCAKVAASPRRVRATSHQQSLVFHIHD